MKPRFTGEEIKKDITPNTIWVEGIVLSPILSKKDCNNKEVEQITFRLEKIIRVGQGIVNKPHVNDKHCFTVITQDTKQLLKNGINKKLKLVIIEKLCSNVNETNYVILDKIP